MSLFARPTLTRLISLSLLTLPITSYGMVLSDAPAEATQATYAMNQLIVKMKSPANLSLGVAAVDQPSLKHRLKRSLSSVGINTTQQRLISGGAQVITLTPGTTKAEIDAMLALLENDPDVEYVHQEQRFYPLEVTPNDTDYSEQWHLGSISNSVASTNATNAWDYTTGSSSLRVAVLDTGVVKTHKDLLGRLASGYDFISDAAIGNDGDGRDSNPTDPGDWYGPTDPEIIGCTNYTDSSWHGTHVAGSIAASSDNNLGVAGIDWKSKIIPVRVLGRCGGTSADLADAIRWSAGISDPALPAPPKHPAKVINMSLGGAGECQASIQDAINDAISAGATVVVAAGNDNKDLSNTPYTPAGCASVITVASVNRSGNRAPYSNYGNIVELSAPGGDKSTGDSDGIKSTYNTGTKGPQSDSYAFQQGTSMAAPQVAGAVSLMLAANRDLSPAQILSGLQSSVRPFPSESNCDNLKCGTGMLDIEQAVLAAAAGKPIANIEATEFAQANNEATLNGSKSVATGGHNIVAYQWQQTAGTPSVALNNANTSIATFTMPDGAKGLAFELTVTDSNSGTARNTVYVTQNTPPVAVNETINVSFGITYKGKVNATDADGDTLTFAIESSDDIIGKLTPDENFAQNGVFYYTATSTKESSQFGFSASDGEEKVSGVIDIKIESGSSSGGGGGGPISLTALLAIALLSLSRVSTRRRKATSL